MHPWILNRQAKALPLPPDMRTTFIENVLAMSLHAYRRIWEEVVDFYVPAALQHVNTPTLITAGGSETKIITQTVATIPKMMPNAQGRLAPALGHGWNVENTDLFTAMVRAWITDTPLPAGLQRAGSGR